VTRQPPPHAADLAALKSTDHDWSVYAVLRSLELRETRKGKPFYTAELADTTRALRAKAWSDSPAFDDLGDLEAGTDVKLICSVEEFEGSPQLKLHRVRAVQESDEDFDPARLRDPILERVGHLACETLVFDIETVPAHDRRKLPSTIAEALAKSAERREQDTEAVMGMSPFFGKVVSIAVGNGDLPEAELAPTALVVPPPDHPAGELPDWILPMSEAEVLRAFWALASAAKTVVSYNGRGFDVPFLATRSLILEVPVTIDLLANRFGIRPHFDLFDILGQRGRGPSNLDTVCWALGIESPKEQMDGAMVAPAYERGEIERIAKYNVHDVRATAAVYRRVRNGMHHLRD